VANARDVLTQSMAILGYRKASLIAGTWASFCAGSAVLGCDQAAEEALRELGCLGWP
jgi:hypothetical protein